MLPVLLVGGLLFLFAVAYLTRLTYGKPPLPRQKPGESPVEARLVLLGTYRVYTWLLWIVLGLGALRILIVRDEAPAWLTAAAVLPGFLLLVAAQALYWRLGYDWRRWVFTLGHLSGLWCLSEYLYSLRRDLENLPDAPATPPERRVG